MFDLEMIIIFTFCLIKNFKLKWTLNGAGKGGVHVSCTHFEAMISILFGTGLRVSGLTSFFANPLLIGCDESCIEKNWWWSGSLWLNDVKFPTSRSQLVVMNRVSQNVITELQDNCSDFHKLWSQTSIFLWLNLNFVSNTNSDFENSKQSKW